MKQIRVLIVDDSVTVRHLLWKVFREDKVFDVVGMVSNGKDALAQVEACKPDIMTLDIEMPVLDGLDTLTAVRRLAPRLPVIVLSSHSEHGALVTLEALSRGAVDYVPKPQQVDSIDAGLDYIRTELLPKVKAVCSKSLNLPLPGLVADPHPGANPPEQRAAIRTAAGTIDVLTIGSSVGGPNALAALIPDLAADFPVPVVVAQHMPPMFTRLLAERLAATSKLRVKEGTHGATLAPGTVWIAPGNGHLTVERRGTSVTLGVHEGTLDGINCRPSVDVLFRSVAVAYGPRVLAIVLSGMGSDGLSGSEAISQAGGQILVQDRESSVVWGMPGFVAGAGLAENVLPLDMLRAAIVRKAWIGRTKP